MRSVGIVGANRNLAEPVSWEEDEVGGAQIATDLSAIERRVGLACAVAKLNRGDSRKKPPPKECGTIVKYRILLLYYLKDQ